MNLYYHYCWNKVSFDHLCKCNGVADIKHAPPHVCYHAEFGRSASQDIGVIRGEPKIWGVLGRRPSYGVVADP